MRCINIFISVIRWPIIRSLAIRERIFVGQQLRRCILDAIACVLWENILCVLLRVPWHEGSRRRSRLQRRLSCATLVHLKRLYYHSYSANRPWKLLLWSGLYNWCTLEGLSHSDVTVYYRNCIATDAYFYVRLYFFNYSRSYISNLWCIFYENS